MDQRNTTDVYFKKEIVYPFKGEEFKFDVAETLFSTFAIDHGTDLLLRSTVLNNPKTILDLGCGYGPIGIVLAKKNPQSEVMMVDRDLLAVEYSLRNIAKNGVLNARVFGSVGIKAVADKKFDLIVSNIPAKIGDKAITWDFIRDPYEHLNDNGEFWFVVVSALNRLISKIGKEFNLKLTEVKKRHGHTVYKIRKL